jgi:hypothetical protein
MITIPNRQTKKVNQNNRSKILGDIWSSFNLDLQSNLGLIKVSPRLQINTSGVTNQGLSVAFSTFNNKIFTIAGTRVFSNSAVDLTSVFTEDAGTGAITTYDPNYSDMQCFNGKLCTTGATKVMSYDGLTWTLRATIGSNTLHKLLWFVKFNRLYYFDGYCQIKSLDTSWAEATSGDYFIDLGSTGFDLGVQYTMCADSSDIWIGMMSPPSATVGNSFSGGHILRWDGISAQITTDYKIKAKGCIALCKDDRNIMHAIDTNGALLQFTGSGFEEIGRLPLNRELLVNANHIIYGQFIHPNGLQFTRNGTFIVLVNNLVDDSAGTIKENLFSGVWEFSKDTGFVHRQSFSYNPLGSSTITDYGQNTVSAVGALTESDLPFSGATGKPTLLAGATIYTNASSTTSGIFVDDPFDTIQKYGYFTTTWIQAQAIKDSYDKAILKYRQLLNSGDKIIAKYRLTEGTPTYFNMTWVNTTSFTTTTDISAMIGYEVEVLQGTGSGKCAHIISVVNNSGTFTVTLDETYTGVTTGTAKARVQNWTKLLTVSDQGSESHKATIGRASARIQLKVCMQFTGEDELHELILINNTHESLT